jgi:hypothetical protein
MRLDDQDKTAHTFAGERLGQFANVIPVPTGPRCGPGELLWNMPQGQNDSAIILELRLFQGVSEISEEQ